MISKAEFLEQVKEEFSEKNKKELVPKNKYHNILKFGIEDVIAFSIILLTFSSLIKIHVVVFFLLLVLSFGIVFILDGVEKRKDNVIALLEKTGLCSPVIVKEVEMTKEEAIEAFDPPEEELKELFGDSDKAIFYEHLFGSENLDKVCGLLFNDADASSSKKTIISFDDIKSILSETEIKFSSFKLNFFGFSIVIELEHSYKDPVVFTKKKFFGRIKKIKKTQLLHRDSYFDVFSNNINSARNLCFQGVPAKLLRLDRRFKVKKTAAVFYENKLYILLSRNESLFEKIFLHSKDIHQYELFYDQIAQLETYCAQFRDL